MKKIELLSPVGNIDMFYAAVSAGADAVYLGGKNFGARAFANNFTNEELKYVINYAHIYNVRVYVTINTTIYESEINDIINYIEFLYKAGVDAVIIQDLGLIKIIKDKFKDLEIHASTQMNITNIEGLKILKDLGVKRVVLAREVSLKEINKMNIDIEKEIFIHGALCMSYSGQCLLSSVIGKRSGNRGLCAGPCRLEYDLLEKNKDNEQIINTNGKYLLSTKDLCTIEYLDEILKSNVDSLKIEGRMKSVEYVYIVTSIYRKAIDNYYKYGKTNITDKDIVELKKIYNRNFTKGYLMGEDKSNINNEVRPNHMGIEIGKVISKNKNRIKIKLSDNLKKNDGIRIISNKDYGFTVNKIFKNNKIVNEAYREDIIELIVDNNIKINSIVLKTLDSDQIENVCENLKEKRKIDINFEVIGRLNEEIILTAYDDKNKITLKSNMKTFMANKTPLTKDRIKEQLSKLNDTPYKLTNIKIDIDDNILIPIKELNELRRNVIEKLINLRTKIDDKKIDKLKEIENKKVNSKICINALVKTEEQLLTCIKNNIDNIYVDKNLYNKYKEKYNNLILTLPRICNNYIEHNNENLQVRSIGELKYYKNNNLYIDYTLNTTNTYNIDVLKQFNSTLITLSIELEDNEIKNILDKTNENLEIILYGNIEIFITKYCILNKHVNKNRVCNICKNNNKYYLIDRKKERYEIINEDCINILLSSNKVNKIDKYNYYKDLGIYNFRLNFYNETAIEVEKIIKNIKRM